MEINFKYLNKDLLDHLYSRAQSDLERALLSGADFSRIKEMERILTQISIEKHRNDRADNFGTPADTPFRA